MNIKGYDSIDTVLERGLHALAPEAFEAAAGETGALVLDVRDPEVFAAGFIPNSINIGLDGQFAPWVGALIPDIQQEVLLVTEVGREAETITRMSRVGYDHVIGYLKGGFSNWQQSGKEVNSIKRINPGELSALAERDETLAVLDVRKRNEYLSEHLVIAESVPLDTINNELSRVPKDKPVYLYCAGGYRSMIFASILMARGYGNIADVRGGFEAIRAEGHLKITDYVCPSSML